MPTLFEYGTVLQIVQDACRQLSLGVPNGVYDSSDGNALLMGSLANNVGIMLADFKGWQQFDEVYTVTGDGSTTEFDMPADMSRARDNTGWSTTNRRPVLAVTHQTQAAVAAWTSSGFFMQPAAIISGDKMVFLVAPANAEIITFQYVSTYWALDADGSTTKARLGANNDKPRFDRLLFTLALKLKWLEAKGMPTTAAQNDFTTRLNQVLPRNALATTLNIAGGISDGRLLDSSNVPDTNFGV